MSALDIYLNEVRSVVSIDREEYSDLIEVLRHGPPAAARAAKERLVVAHLPLAFAHAKRIAETNPVAQLEDLVQAANIGLIKAAEKFDPWKGT